MMRGVEDAIVRVLCYAAGLGIALLLLGAALGAWLP